MLTNEVTRVYGTSDDLIEVEGGKAAGEFGCYGTDDSKQGVLLVFDDGTVLEVKYGKNDEAIWEIKVKHKGTEFDRIELCDSDDADPYSDQVFFKREMKWCYAAREWEMVR